VNTDEILALGKGAKAYAAPAKASIQDTKTIAEAFEMGRDRQDLGKMLASKNRDLRLYRPDHAPGNQYPVECPGLRSAPASMPGLHT
jgi:hypothetical protein